MVFFETCGPSEVLVVSGACNSTPKYITGGRAFVWPFVQQADRLSLNTMTLEIKSDGVYTELGVSISVTGIAQVRIHGRNDEMLQAACQQFLGKAEAEIQQIAHETLEGHQRAIMGNMTVEEIYQDRQKFSQGVFEVASSDLVNMGITVVSYTITDVSDDQGYMHALGMGRTAQVIRDARVGEAEATKDSEIKKSLAQEAEMKAKYTNDIAIAQAQRDFELKKAEYDIEVNTKKAESDLAYQLQAAKTNQKIKEQQMEVKVVERTQQIALEEQEILRKEKELESRVQKPADAYKFKMERLAEAERNRTVLEAQAEAEAIQVKGEAEAYAIEAKAKAEAEQMAKKADAWKEYQDAAMVDMMLETLPKVVAEIAAPLSKANKITMVSQGPGDIGAAKLTGEVMSIVNQLPSAVREMTGVDISKAMKSAQRAK